MPTNFLNTMPQHEPLPVYRRDPETSSIRSSAPSYTSEAPSYHSTLPQSRYGLAPATYAPGFRNLRTPDRSGLSHLNFNINQWSSAYSSPQARCYHNVATRRTNLAMIEEQNFVAAALSSQIVTFPVLAVPVTAAAVPEVAGTMSTSALPAVENTPSTSTVQQAPPTPQVLLPSIEPLSPLEDPDLVGHVAASAARERRLFIARETRVRRRQQEEREAREAHALNEESWRWDFLLAQMADWEERERGWKVFSDRLNKKANRSNAKKVLFRFWK